MYRKLKEWQEEMSVEESELKRVFKYNGRELPDPDPDMAPQEVMELYARQYPALSSGEIGGPYYDGDQQNWKLEGKKGYNMSGSYGTKG